MRKISEISVDKLFNSCYRRQHEDVHGSTSESGAGNLGGEPELSQGRCICRRGRGQLLPNGERDHGNLEHVAAEIGFFPIAEPHVWQRKSRGGAA